MRHFDLFYGILHIYDILMIIYFAQNLLYLFSVFSNSIYPFKKDCFSRDFDVYHVDIRKQILLLTKPCRVWTLLSALRKDIKDYENGVSCIFVMYSCIWRWFLSAFVTKQNTAWSNNGFQRCGLKVNMLKSFDLLFFYFAPVFLAFYIYLFLIFSMDGKRQQQKWQTKKALKPKCLKWFLYVTSSKAFSNKCSGKNNCSENYNQNPNTCD